MTQPHGNRLANPLADVAVGVHGSRVIASVGIAYCLLDRIFKLALEIFGRIPGGVAHRASAHGARVLCSRSPWPAQSPGPLVDIANGPHSRIHVHWTRDRINRLQLALCGAAL